MMSGRSRKAVRTAGASRTLMFAAAGLPLGVPLEDLLRVSETSELLPMPVAHPALLGVVESLEGATPVYDLAMLCGVARSRTPFPLGMLAMFPHPTGSVAIHLDKLAGLTDSAIALDPSLQAKLLAALPPPIQPMITGAASSRGQLFFYFSRDAFLGWVAAAGER